MAQLDAAGVSWFSSAYMGTVENQLTTKKSPIIEEIYRKIFGRFRHFKNIDSFLIEICLKFQCVLFSVLNEPAPHTFKK